MGKKETTFYGVDISESECMDHSDVAAYLRQQHLAVAVMHAQAGVHVQGQVPPLRQTPLAGQSLQVGGQSGTIPPSLLLMQCCYYLHRHTRG